ncbi:hypothetical protein [Hymenobacter sp. UYP22]|uniref:ORC-CDC6 family AAA ATPase n=1 Tax=Hymenobacter sp. UYP22 TaxID=3156348 RepID=UPI00339A51F3
MKNQEKQHSSLDYGAALSELPHLFAHKAEWLHHDLYTLFKSPGYFKVLELNQSCILVGDRGTGKTSVLSGLSYEGQYRLSQSHFNDWKFLGVYFRIEGFGNLRGKGKSEEDWIMLFSHYFNLVICNVILKMLLWYESTEKCQLKLTHTDWTLFLESLSITVDSKNPFTAKMLSQELEMSIAKFSKYTNNIQDPKNQTLQFSTLGHPIDYLIDIIYQLHPFSGKPIYIMLDEYEVFSDYQQMVVNTLIKQSPGRKYCFKVGVRELGWREKKTIEGQVLQAPNDFSRISIRDYLNDENFSPFAEQVCNQRLELLQQYLPKGLAPVTLTVKNLLPHLSYADEAEILGVKKLTNAILSNPSLSLSDKQLTALRELRPVSVWFAHEWGARRNISSSESLRNLLDYPRPWRNRLDNYLYASLFAIKSGGRKKLYSGWDTYLLMARGNIRFLFQLLVAALSRQLQEDGLNGPIHHYHQTDAASAVGKNNLSELEGVDVKGRTIMRLVTGLGRVFQIFAEEPFNSGPEVNQFFVPELNGDTVESDEEVLEAKAILEMSYSHLGLMREEGNKLGREEVRGDIYFVHPIFSAHFNCSFRKKRKTTIHATEILGLLHSQEKTTREIVARKNKNKDRALKHDGLFTSNLPSTHRRRRGGLDDKPNITGQLPLLFNPEE